MPAVLLSRAAPDVLHTRGGFEAVSRFAAATGWLHATMAVIAGWGAAVFAVLLAVAVNQPVAHAVAEQRPFAGFPSAVVLLHRSTDPGFPSDHATMAGAVAVGLFLVNRRLGAVTAALALVLAFSRVYVGVHYPGDVVAGLVLGALVVLVGGLVALPVLTWVVERVSAGPGRVLVARAWPAA